MRTLVVGAALCLSTRASLDAQSEQTSLLQRRIASSADMGQEIDCLHANSKCKPPKTTSPPTTTPGGYGTTTTPGGYGATTTTTPGGYGATTTTTPGGYATTVPHPGEFGATSTTSTTTRAPLPLPSLNCATPTDAKVCHFWGDPHFTHLFNDKLDERDVHKGGRMHGGAVLNFNPSGVFELASAEDFKVQAFFCPAYADTTTGVGLAMQIGDDTIQIIRGEETRPTENAAAHDYGYFANLLGDESKFTEFYLNGQKKEWSDLGDAVNTRGDHVPGTGGVTSVSAFLRQMKTAHESSISMLPVCAGDDKHHLVEVSTPWFDSTTGQRVYEHAVTIRSSAANLGGLCAASADAISSNSESFRVKPANNLFTSKQMNSLCGQCRLHMDNGACGAPGQDVSAKAVCEATQADYDSAASDCKNEGFTEGTSWFEACVVETCVTGKQALPIAKMEQQLAALEFGS